MSRITMCIEEEFSGKVIGSFDLTEYADKVYNQALDDFVEKLGNYTIVCNDGVTEAVEMKEILRCREHLKKY